MKKKNNYTFAFDRKMRNRYKFRRLILVVLLIVLLAVIFAFGLNYYFGQKNTEIDLGGNDENSGVEGSADNTGSDNGNIVIGNDDNNNDDNNNDDNNNDITDGDSTTSDNVIDNGNSDNSDNSSVDEGCIVKPGDDGTSDKPDNGDVVDIDDGNSIKKEDYDFSLAVPKTDESNENYMEDSVFIGNSIVDGLKLFQIVKDADVFSAKGIMVDTIFTKEVIKAPGGKRVTIFDAMKGNEYKNIYVLLGANELGWPYIEVFIKQYEKVIDELQDMYPDANIYINGITPVTARKSASTTIYTNDKIAYFNKNILKMCEDRKLFYIDSVEALGDDNDELPEEESVDGAHFKVATYNIWVDYLKNHTVEFDKYKDFDKVEEEYEKGN